MSFAEAGFWFLLGFFLASWLAHRAIRNNQAKALRNFQVAKTEVLRLLDTVKDLTEIKITIVDEEFEIQADEKPPGPPRGDMH